MLDLLPTLSRGELLTVAFRVAGLAGPPIEAPQELLLQTKTRMQQVLRDRPLAEWGEALALFVAEAKRQGFKGTRGRPVAEDLHVLLECPNGRVYEDPGPAARPPGARQGTFCLLSNAAATAEPRVRKWPTTPYRQSSERTGSLLNRGKKGLRK